jgi:PAS domain S-box-containing protein
MSVASYDSVVTEIATRKKSSGSSLAKTYPAYATLIAGLILTAFFWNYVSKTVSSEQKAAFDKATSSVMARMERSVNAHEQILKSIEGLYANSVQVVRDVFELYAGIPAGTYSSVLSINYVPYVSAGYKEQFIYYARSERYYNYEIKPSGNREFYHPVEYTVPFELNQHRSGHDYAQEAPALAAIEKARSGHQTIASAFYPVRPDTLGFLLMFAVQKEITDPIARELLGDKIDGTVTMEIHAGQFFQNSLNAAAATDTTILFEVADGNSTVYKSANFQLAGQGYKPLLEDVKNLAIADRSLSVKFSSVPSFGTGFQAYLPLLTLIGGIVTSFVAFGFVLSITTSRARALDIADRITRSQRRIVDSSQDIIAVIDLESLGWKTLNPAVQSILGFAPDALVGKTFTDNFATESAKNQLRHHLIDSRDEEGSVFDTEMITNTGKNCWISWNLTVSRTDGLIYAIGRDVTLQKSAEQEARLRSLQVRLAEQYALESSEFKSRFMRELSHKLRNSLTGTMGFLQLLGEHGYESEQDKDDFIHTAERSSEELFSVVTDIIDIAGNESNDGDGSERVMLSDAVHEAEIWLRTKLPDYTKLSFHKTPELSSIALFTDKKVLSRALGHLCNSLVAGNANSEIMINARENKYEKVIEIEMLASYSADNAALIEVYKAHSNNLIEHLKQDQHDILFNLGISTSLLKQLSGTLLVESLGEKDGNVAQITIPLVAIM